LNDLVAFYEIQADVSLNCYKFNHTSKQNNKNVMDPLFEDLPKLPSPINDLQIDYSKLSYDVLINPMINGGNIYSSYTQVS